MLEKQLHKKIENETDTGFGACRDFKYVAIRKGVVLLSAMIGECRLLRNIGESQSGETTNKNHALYNPRA